MDRVQPTGTDSRPEFGIHRVGQADSGRRRGGCRGTGTKRYPIQALIRRCIIEPMLC